MDVLSQAITAMRTGRPRSYRVECHSPWGRRYQPVAGAGFHVILQGSAWLIAPDGAPLALGLGDVVLLPRGRRHGMADRPDARLVTVDHDVGTFEQVEPHTVRVGPDRPGGDTLSTVMLCGMYQLDQVRPHPLIRDLPEVVHLPARLGRHPELRALAARLLRDSDEPLSTVARQVGYASEFAFANAFKREYGSAPGRYRQAHSVGRLKARGRPR